MKNKNIKVVVSGDIAINSLQWITHPQNNHGFNWQTYSNFHCISKPGESLLLADLVTLATKATVLSPRIEDIESTSNKEFLRSVVELDLFPVFNEKNKDKVYRVKRFLGFIGPLTGIPKLLPIENDDANIPLVIIDDENNGFNESEEFWPLAITTPEKSPIILYKMNNPIGSSTLWKHLEKFHDEKTIVIINGDDLRSKGVNISKSLSWERTAQDFAWQINNNPNLSFLAKCKHLIIPFGLEGAIYYRNDSVTESRLFFLPYEFEGGSIKETQGKMYGLTSCFVAGLTRSITSNISHGVELDIAISAGIREGIVSAQKYFIAGFGSNIQQLLFPRPEIFIEKQRDFIRKEHVQDVKIPNTFNSNCASCWYILKDKSSSNLADIAYEIVKNGEKEVLKFMPIARFGKLKTVDKTEIESYRSIKNLMWEYMSSKNTVRPLSIAVFGTPGSGKSFGVTEVATSIAPNSISKLNFNLSQFRSLTDLSNAFHKVRDLSLEGKIPLVFFDEFDSAFDRTLGWLQYFLAPMQDGLFREGDSIHPIGKAIFVFVGGTCSTYEEFCGEGIQDAPEQKLSQREFRSAKGPDFVSRLRGYVNILGPNQTNSKTDQLFIIRRAMVLRSLLEFKVPHLINEKGEAQIDNGVLRALLKVPKYKHESRSMEAILEMSMLTRAKKWEQSHLPSKEQLKLHVDEEQFSRHLMHDAFFSEKIETLALAIHKKYSILNIDNPTVAPDLVNPWEFLSGDLKNYYREHVKNIPNALLQIHYDLISVKEKPEAIKFTEAELKKLVDFEFKRCVLNKSDNVYRISDSLLEDEINKIYQMIIFWPEILANSNFKIERLKFLCQCEANNLA